MLFDGFLHRALHGHFGALQQPQLKKRSLAA
jgi:hypothetical protein